MITKNHLRVSMSLLVNHLAPMLSEHVYHCGCSDQVLQVKTPVWLVLLQPSGAFYQKSDDWDCRIP